jgi:two-component system chemotaxis sensor kinase CheA
VRVLAHSVERLKAQLDNTLRLAARIQEFAEAGSVAGRPDGADARSFLGSLKRMAETIARERGKKVEVDTDLSADSLPPLGKLRNSAIHLVRNAIDHGIEDELERVASGKSGVGHIRIGIRNEGGECIIEVTDDGRGIDFAEVAKRARAKGLIPAGGPRDNQRLLGILFSPGYSSRDEADDISGRGFGLDVARDALLALGGRITVATKKGRGSRFRLILPVGEEQK